MYWHPCNFSEKKAKKGNILKIWAKIYKIQKYFKKGQAIIACNKLLEIDLSM